MAAKQQVAAAASATAQTDMQQPPAHDPLAAVKSTAEHIVGVIMAKEVFRYEIKSNKRVVNLIIYFNEPRDQKSVLVRRLYTTPTEWQLDAKELSFVNSVVYDVPNSKLTIRLVKRTATDKTVVAAQERSWEEVFGSTKLDPRYLAAIPVSGIECTKDDVHLQELVKRIVKEAVAVATQRDEEVKARLTVFSREYQDDPYFVIAISGLRAIGALTFTPTKWSDAIPLTIRETLSVLFRIDEDNKTKRVNELRIAIKEATLKKMREMFPVPGSTWPIPPPPPPPTHQPPSIDMREITQ